jgi:acyl-coenzyme A thioesterase PaaI-like protein
MSEEIEAATMCFACGQENPIGLKIRFHFDGEVCTADFTPNENHVGYQNTVHGGIIYTALDDVTANIMYRQGRKAHTARCEIRYRQVARVGEPLKLKGWIDEERRRLVKLKGEVRRADDDVLVAECESSFMLERP